MTISITPGYDFGPNETPTRATLQQAAAGLQITGIPVSSLAAGIIAVHINDTTAASNLPGEGFLWVDARNNIWGRTGDGDVIVRRYQGGWETNRFKCLGDVGGNPNEPPGVAWIVSTVSANSTSINDMRTARGRQTGETGAQLQPFVNQETAASSFDTHFRFVGRGPTRFYCPGFLPSSPSPRMKGRMNGSFSSYWVATDFDAAGAVGVQFETDEREPELSGPASVSECRGYFFGLTIKKI